jgi:hypothetical protein
VRLFLTTCLCLLAGLLSLGSGSAWGETLPLVDTSAGQAFKTRQYDIALAEFQKLAAQHPKDALVLRYLAITLDRLGRYQDAIKIYHQALALTPLNPSLHFHMGTTYYKGGWTDYAEQSFRRVIQIAPDTLYGERARQYLDALVQQRVQLQPPGLPKPWGFYFQAGLQTDSNIPAAPRDPALFTGDRSGVRIFEYLWGTYRFLRQPGWLGALEASTYQAQYPEDAFRRFRLSLYTLGASLQRTTTLWSLPFIGSVKYEHRTALLGGDTYSRSHVVTAGSQIGFTPETSTHAYYRYTRDDFTNEGFDPALSSRDADHHVFGLAQVWYFANRKGQVRVGYEFQDNRADGLNFKMDGHKISLGGVIPLPWEVQANLGADYSRETYPDFQGPVRRKTDRRSFTAGLSKWFTRHILGRLDAAYTNEGSTYDLLSYRRWVFGGSVAYVY